MFHYVYKIDDVDNNMSYIGARSSKCYPTEDSYMSSSKYLQEAIKQKGLDKFKKTILAIFSTRVDAVDYEIRLHDYFDVGNNPNFYNKAKQTSTKFDTTGIKLVFSEEHRKKMGEWQKGKKKSYDVWNKGKTGLQQMTEEEKEKRSKAYSGEHNPMYGRSAAKELNLKWYNNGERNMFIPEGTQPEGFVRGRGKIRFNQTCNKMDGNDDYI